MKLFGLVAFIPAILLISNAAFAMTGSKGLNCVSPSGAKQKISISISKTNQDGTEDDTGFPAELTAQIDGTKAKFTNEKQALGVILADHIKDGVLTVEISQKDASQEGYLEIWALPKTLVLKKGSDEFNGSATFKAKITGTVENGNSSAFVGGDDGEVLNCSYKYDGGSAG